MAVVVRMHTDAATRQRLGSGLTEITECLWAKDCQTCGQPLADAGPDPSLAVDEVGAFALASLHHPQCRPPGWNDTDPLTMTTVPTLSSASTTLELSFTQRPERYTLVLTNPALEMIPIHPAGDGWRPDLSLYLATGLNPGTRLQIGQPIAGASATLGPASIRLTMRTAPFETYTAPADPPALELAREADGLMWAVSYALHPGHLDNPDLAATLAASRIATGWVTLAT